MKRFQGKRGPLPQAAAKPEIGRRLLIARKAKYLGNKTQVCEALGIEHISTYSQWESGISFPNMYDAIRFSDTFKVPLDWIYLGRTDGMPSQIEKRFLELSRLSPEDLAALPDHVVDESALV